MKEILKEMKLDEKIYLIQELKDVDEDDPLVKIGGYFSAQKINPSYDPEGKYSGLVIIPQSKFNMELSKNIKEFAIFHEIGHCQKGGLPDNQIEYNTNSLKYEKIADYFAVIHLGKQKVLNALKEFYEVESIHLKNLFGNSPVLEAFNVEMNLRLKFIEEFTV